ncbi:hypothetical protein K7432_008793 [Basidiobolus ranarum]|uniref:Uncharacterized protein n=1 Tax=Basidiobolus ranarum TaxID=34480 RepID=A0ABR2WRA3_9FUNG
MPVQNTRLVVNKFHDRQDWIFPAECELPPPSNTQRFGNFGTKKYPSGRSGSRYPLDLSRFG